MHARPPRARLLAGQQRDGEHAQGERRQRQTGLHRVVLEHHLEEDRQRDHQAAERDLLHHLLGDPAPEVGGPEQVGVEQGLLARALAPDQPGGEGREGGDADRDQGAHRLAALLPDEDPQHDAAHAEDGEDRADGVDAAWPGVRDVLHHLDPGEHDRDDDDLQQEADAPRQVGGDEPAEERPDGGGDRGGGADEGVGLRLRLPGEVAVDQRLHGRQQQRGADPAEDRPEDDDRGQALGERHRQRADGIGEQADHVGPFAADQVADLAVDQDERRRDQRFEGDRRLDAAHRRAEVLDDRRDRDVHHRGVDHQHEHRRRQQQAQPRVVGGGVGSGGADGCGHWLDSSSRPCLLGHTDRPVSRKP